MQRFLTSASRSGEPGGASRVRRRALLGTAVLVLLVALAGLAAYLTRDGSATPNPHVPQLSSAPFPSTAPAASSPTPPAGERGKLPVAPSTRDPITFAKAAAVALWSYDTRAYSQPVLEAALHRWLTGEAQYADAASVDALVPSPVLWGRMADSGQFAIATVTEAHFPDSFTRALQADPGALTQAYVYAVTVSGRQAIAWNGAAAGGGEDRVTTLAVQCRPSQPCALAGVLPAVAP
ncbi:hypothetical protein E6W39_06585 [Kitasatospora acidiphila]|uniref:Uncharacterized protein n=1 Tax=Kitasatospora acidiphila TaxID=2567942 RepID=A0A540W0Y1_9ACTN|nr:hypothetical protein [Kitasatospora acidiphila]TQF02004.1 hypothetical protein E6W39_06585 [Kitasatospora acidiphila]